MQAGSFTGSEMSQPHAHLAFAPRGPGLLYAVMWFAEGDHVYGWFTGARNGGTLSSYFMLQDHFAARDTVFMRSLQNDVDSEWVEVGARREVALAHVPVPEAVRHELRRLQDVFVRHWLFFDDDPDSADEAQALRARELPVRHANVRASRLNKMQHGAAVWRHDAPDADVNVLVFLSKRWPLDFDVMA